MSTHTEGCVYMLLSIINGKKGHNLKECKEGGRKGLGKEREAGNDVIKIPKKI